MSNDGYGGIAKHAKEQGTTPAFAGVIVNYANKCMTRVDVF